MSDIKKILQTAKRIGIVGLSPDIAKDSNQVGKYLQQKGFKIIPIYPKEEKILEQKVYRNVKEALENENIDILVIFRKSEICVDIALEVLSAKTLPKVFWMQLGISNTQAKDMLESKGIQVIENKCIKIEYQALGE
ncbi:CoA-binding protein [Helicobacter cappadocius]|uniref:CoA-binding protein n=1 Tax=Helicobacter cappadocius TaxID=3063998 RepID=A0AA90PXC2_9HELI|nr:MULTISPECIES: CoA-binding protein [unclassified Helicobacter]MDO7252441.1 CoA-binding protein [Helicobacter sp. faydin-H75]MDP2538308.1 CoA-binding protein [Helicobacter sp. faydin-H76]